MLRCVCLIGTFPDGLDYLLQLRVLVDLLQNTLNNANLEESSFRVVSFREDGWFTIKFETKVAKSFRCRCISQWI